MVDTGSLYPTRVLVFLDTHRTTFPRLPCGWVWQSCECILANVMRMGETQPFLTQPMKTFHGKTSSFLSVGLRHISTISLHITVAGNRASRASLVAQQVRFCLQCRRPRFDPWVGKIPWRREWQLTPVFLPGESHVQSSLAG